jgi:membrane peptidoglycan carboxypeptidase
MLRFLKYLFGTFLFLALLAVAVGVGGLYYLVVEAPCPEMEESYIESILGRESPVYYRDGKEKLGVLFQGIHRQYLTYDQIPRNFVNAITAAEDDQFFTHFGIDIPGIVRAVIANYRAGRVVQGGSTITQQTAKNLFKRESRSYRAKLKELLYALRLEHRFSKEKILEFYSNQFYVSGNGHGLGVAARYYFDKTPDELTLLEAAFIAGSVKRPNYYNPFTKKNRKDARKALRRADERAAYVLGKMRKLGMITETEYRSALERDIEFRQGKMSFALNTSMDLVKEGLATFMITEVLEDHGISNIATSGARIITTLDKKLQESTLYSLRRHLSLLDVRLRGYERKQVQDEYAQLKYSGDAEIKPHAFVFGTVDSIDLSDRKNPVIHVVFGPGKTAGFIDRAGLERMVDALVKYRKNRWAKPGKKDLAVLLERFKPGDKIYVSVREVDFFDNTPTLDLEKYPQVQGAAMVMQQGMIRAMAGGTENRFYNRAVSAKRLMGSTFKPFLFSAALQLGWSPTDQLDNRRNVFVFMDRPYFPRPDHHSPFDFVSMSWAGVKSENVAAVWLLYHLVDRLTSPQLREVARYLDMMPRTSGGVQESYRSFKQRIRDRYGIRISSDILNRAAYERAVKNLETDFLFDNRTAEYQQIQKMPYGLHFDRFHTALTEALKDKKLKSWQRKELKLRLSMLVNNFLHLQAVYRAMQDYKTYLESSGGPGPDALAYFDAVSTGRPPGRMARNGQGELLYTLAVHLPQSWTPVRDQEIRGELASMFPSDRTDFWNRVKLNDFVSASVFARVSSQMQIERAALASYKPYTMEVLENISDYKIMLGLQYLIQLGRQAGLTSRLEPILSFPLGSNVVTLAETMRMYETMVTGSRQDIQLPNGFEEIDMEEGDRDGLSIIERIEGPDGRIIYSRGVTPKPVYDAATSSSLDNILQNVVLYGTGRYARDHVRLHSENEKQEQALEDMDLPLPLLGKTGTANDFRNASFMGYVPVGLAPEGAALTLKPGYTVGVYVGFDDNRKLKKGSTRISGAQGALPVWADIASALYDLERIGDKVDPVDLVFNGIGLKYPDTGQLFVPVNLKDGGRIIDGQGAKRSRIPPDYPAILAHGNVGSNNHFEPKPIFRPFWLNQD